MTLQGAFSLYKTQKLTSRELIVMRILSLNFKGLEFIFGCYMYSYFTITIKCTGCPFQSLRIMIVIFEKNLALSYTEKLKCKFITINADFTTSQIHLKENLEIYSLCNYKYLRLFVKSYRNKRKTLLL